MIVSFFSIQVSHIFEIHNFKTRSALYAFVRKHLIEEMWRFKGLAAEFIDC